MERYFRRIFWLSGQGDAAYIDAVRAKPSLVARYFGKLQQPESAGFKLHISLSSAPTARRTRFRAGRGIGEEAVARGAEALEANSRGRAGLIGGSIVFGRQEAGIQRFRW